ncbi:sorbosone dehydrogenase family protein [Rhodocytophaga rosea]|uniref:Sorbosone dehydrogenase family protein n=1 Tax=Rhodocytophaga rosea TaxID=2704465 RepID=A0A6C0GLU0_9BACT|nr:PQQ-dependent sugar dehydrogenase [Rhodocytophaga rosea]QHT68907.1 sorbosone dehydrogenase family protein [Rhodocytophaga rosea]
MKMIFKPLAIGFACASMLLGGCQDKEDEKETIPQNEYEPTFTKVTGYVFKPAIVPASDENVNKLNKPQGFTVNKFAEGGGKFRMLAVSSTGVVYATDREAGTLTMFRDINADGKADERQVVATRQNMHGITIYNNTMYMVTAREVLSAAINSNGTLGGLQILMTDLPDAGQHNNRTIAFGPDGLMYISIGSTCNACEESNKENATLVRANPDGTNRKIFAKGLRNMIGFGWHPQTKELWGMDHGIDWLGDEDQKEELNKIAQGADYGWPYIYGEGKFYPQLAPPGDTTYQQYLAKTTLPLLTYEAHSAPLGMIFYTGSTFPPEYQNDAFVAMRGSWNRKQPSGYKIVRLHFENGQPTQFQDFVGSFLVNDNKGQFARITGITVHTDGSLLVADDSNGVIYRIAYSGQ